VHKPFFEFAIEYGFTQIVERPTRGSNILDIVLVDNVQAILNIAYLSPFLVAIMMQFCFLYFFEQKCIDCNQESDRYYYCWFDANFDDMIDIFQSINWLSIVSNYPSAECMWSVFRDILKQTINATVPQRCLGARSLKKTVKRKYPRVICKELRKKSFWRKCKIQHKSHFFRTRYRESCHKVRQLLRASEIAQELKVVNADNLETFYRYVNRRLTSKSGISPLYDDHGKLVSDNAAKANLLNYYFASVCTDDNKCMPTVYHRVDFTCSLSNISFTVNNVEAAIKRLKSNLSSGPDELPPLLFKKLGLVIAQPLAIFYHQLFSVSFIPSKWKHAVITPVLKKGLSFFVSNYRPISLTCVTSKIMESIISDQIHSYFLFNGLINEAQHGFLKGLSTTTNLLQPTSICFINKLAEILGPMFVTAKFFADDLKVYAEVLTTIDVDCFQFALDRIAA